MLNQTQKDMVINEITALTSIDEMFTAFDVTRRVRAAGSTVRHFDVKRLVHSTYNNGNFPLEYERNLKSIGNLSPFLYHPMSKDPEDYDSQSLSPTTLAQVLSDDDDDDDDDVIIRGKAGRLRINHRFLQDINVKAGDEVLCYPYGQNIRIIKAGMTGPNVTNSKRYVADQYGNVRLNPIFVNKTSVDEGFYISVHNSEYIELKV